VPDAFRLERDVLSGGAVDLLFVEAAVNDTTNETDTNRMLRGMEGIVRHARMANPMADIVQMHFVMPEHMADYNQGRVPVSVGQHERVAVHYGCPSLNLSLEVTDRIAAKEFTWAGDFRDVHPSPYGQRVYANSIMRMLDSAFAAPAAAPVKYLLPDKPLDPQSYFRGRLGRLEDARNLKGFTLVLSWKPADGKGTREGFVDVPALVATEPGAELEFAFEGQGAGLFITAGPDAGVVEFCTDGGAWQKVDTFTPWSPGLHLPWAVMLDHGLKPGRHIARVRIASEHNPKSSGTALRIIHLLLN
jgi:sialidase-1